MKPIEPGCLAVIVGGNPNFNGRVVTPVRFIGKLDYFPEPDQWLCDAEWTIPTGVMPYCPERSLLRIDGFEEPEETEALEAIGVEHG